MAVHMRFEIIPKLIRYFLAAFFCCLALVLPYKLRKFYVKILAFFVHLPYILFGRLVRFFFKTLNLKYSDIDWKNQ